MFSSPRSYGADGALGLEIEVVKGSGKNKTTRKGKEEKPKIKEKVLLFTSVLCSVSFKPLTVTVCHQVTVDKVRFQVTRLMR